jgi:hypothetical protein
MMADLPYDPKKYGNNKMGSGAGPAPPFRNWFCYYISLK